ncbi:Tyrosine-protein kinase Wzc [hydrothermal vent metagenome]|uniref:non-specific protein-tyrosine kinase n=1 Tax=hydrothermal vent metagenome TaxID=652676 RepID=A0A1W1BK27_9ZZZZ
MQNIQIEEDEIDLSQLFSTLKKNFFTIVFITLFITSLVVVYSYFLPPIYSSDVKISFSNEEKSSMSSLIPNALADFTATTEKKLETVKLTLETRKFINSVIKELDINQRYFIEHNYRKDELYAFDNLEVSLNIHDDNFKEKYDGTLYDKLFTIKPIDKKHFLLSVDAMEYNRTCSYNKLVSNAYFSIKVIKKSYLEDTNYYISQSNPQLLADHILENMKTTILSDNVLQITYTDTVAKRAKEIVQEIANQFREFTLVKKTSELKKRLIFINGQIGIIENQLQGEGKNLKEYQKKHKTFFTIETNNKMILEKLAEKKEMIETLKLQLKELNDFQKSFKKGNLNTVSLLNNGINISSIEPLIERFHAIDIELEDMRIQAKNIEKSLTKRPQLEQLIQRLHKEKDTLEELNFNFTPTHPQVVKTNNTIIEIENDIRSYIQTDLNRLRKSKSSIKTKIIANINTTKKSIEHKLNIFKHDIQNENALMQTLPEKSLTVQELKRKFTLSENIYTFLLQKKMETQMSLASVIENTQIIESAREGLKPIKPNKKLIVIVGFITSLILAIFYVFLKSMLDTKIRNEANIKELTDAPLYGSLPNKKHKRFFEEAMRVIRTNLQFIIPKDKQCISILVSSTVPGEGKTTVIANLAHIIAQSNQKRVLIMDLDLRKPRLYQELNKSNKLGMTQYLTGDFELESCIQEVNEHLDFFPAGAIPPNPSELLMSEKFDKTIKKLFLTYDYILFDTSPIGSIIDAKILLPYSDIVLLVVRANVAEKGFIEHFNNLRKETEIQSSGIILNDVKHDKSSSYGYGYGYGYGV